LGDFGERVERLERLNVGYRVVIEGDCCSGYTLRACGGQRDECVAQSLRCGNGWAGFGECLRIANSGDKCGDEPA